MSKVKSVPFHCIIITGLLENLAC